VDHSTTPTRDATKNPRPAESAAVCAGKLQSKRLGFGADCKPVSRLHSLLTHRNLWHAGWRLKRAFRFRKVLWLPSSKESKTRTNTALCLRRGVGRDAPVLGCRAGRESRTAPVAPDSCPALLVHEGTRRGNLLGPCEGDEVGACEVNRPSQAARRMTDALGRDAPVLGWRAGRESRTTLVAPDSGSVFFLPNKQKNDSSLNLNSLPRRGA
jgi:hypothetical protein